LKVELSTAAAILGFKHIRISQVVIIIITVKVHRVAKTSTFYFLNNLIARKSTS